MRTCRSSTQSGFIDSWMKPEDANRYRQMKEVAKGNGDGKEKSKEKGQIKAEGQKAHQMRRSAFSAYLFQILGNKHLVLAMIRSPCTSAAELHHFITEWRKHKEPDKYKQTVAQKAQ